MPVTCQTWNSPRHSTRPSRTFSRIGYSRIAMRAGIALALLLACTAPLGAEDRPVRQFDEILDQYVRDGMVYYRALRQDHAKLEAYLAWLAAESVEKAPRAQQLAFWLNAYDAL